MTLPSWVDGHGPLGVLAALFIFSTVAVIVVQHLVTYTAFAVSIILLVFAVYREFDGDLGFGFK